ncbi:MAG: hypothetical protein OXC82_05385 [Rhodobacteraceae bacterium]|nr:hypothetical protein [Paracoccaceae bacterium]MCY4249856.1 hypothetical protein [Paracoccaceae bacterium]MCY4308011.1 hypothetical protein [Paracoccaceae bacterium]
MPALEDIMNFHWLNHLGMSIRTIALHTGRDRHTVIKYLKNLLKEAQYTSPVLQNQAMDSYKDYPVETSP